MSYLQIHRAQISVLRSLRKSKSARYTDLIIPTGLESDVFKFHLRKLITMGFIKKNKEQFYSLTKLGKEFANNLDDEKRTIQKQPKLSLLFLVESNDKKHFLFQQRKRQPYYDYWGLLSGPVQWGEDFIDTAQQEFEKQTGLTAEYEICTFIRQRDYLKDPVELLEDKLFIVVKAFNVGGSIQNTWKGGYNKWMSLDELELVENYFSATRESIRLAQGNEKFSNFSISYDTSDY